MKIKNPVIIITLLLSSMQLSFCAQKPPQAIISPMEQSMIRQGLLNVQDVNPRIFVHLAYSTTNNFLGLDVYGDLNKAYLQTNAALMLSKAQAILEKSHPDYHLIVYDGARPNSVQWKMWELVAGTPSQGYVANPERGSIHNFGCAVDLSIVDEQGQPLDMGTPFDYFGDLAQPRYEEKYLAEGKLTQKQLANRMLLRNTMTAAGFEMIRNEWWHFNAYSIQEVKKRFQIIK